MAGYVRQAAAKIIPGNVVMAIDLNNEFNALAEAFRPADGHSHDGSSGNGPRISLTRGISGVLLPLNGGTGETSLEASRIALGAMRQTPISSGDLDSLTEVGYFSTVDGSHGAPVPEEGFVFNYKYSTLSPRGYQIFWSLVTSSTYHRRHDGNVWEAWKPSSDSTVSYAVSQTLSALEKKTARDNIEATSIADFGDLREDFDIEIAKKINLSGGVMTGFLTLSSAPTDNNHAVTKKYADDRIAQFAGVQSFTVTVPTGMTVAGSPMTTTGTVALGYAAGFEGFTTAMKNKLGGIEDGAQKTSVAHVNTAVTSVPITAGNPTDADIVWGSNSVGTSAQRRTWGAIRAWVKGFITKADVGLNNVANIAPADLPISTATQNALNSKQANLGYVPVNKAGDTVPYLRATNQPSNGADLTRKDYVDSKINNDVAQWTIDLGGGQIGAYATFAAASGGIGSNGTFYEVAGSSIRYWREHLDGGGKFGNIAPAGTWKAMQPQSIDGNNAISFKRIR